MLTSHPTGVRGLKYPLVIIRTANTESHPTGVRGLKCLPARHVTSVDEVAPHWGAWIEIPTAMA